jgi:hypothetical protein
MSSESQAEPDRLTWSTRLVFTVVAVAAFALGIVGYGQFLPDHPEYGHGPLDRVYYSLQLFVLDAGPQQTAVHLPMALQIARFAAPAATAYLIFLAVQALAAERLMQARIRLTRRHSILCGPQDMVQQLAEQIRGESGGTVVVIASRGRRAAGRGPLYVTGDPRHGQALLRAGLDRAREIIVVGPDSVLNAEVAIAVHAVNLERRTAVICYAEARDTELFRAVVGQEVAAGDVNRLDSFNRHDRTAWALLDAYPPAPAAEAGSVLVIGYAGLGRVLVDRLVRGWLGGTLPGGPGRCVCVLDADTPAEVVTRRHSDPEGRVAVTARQVDPSWLTTVDDLLVAAADGTPGVPGQIYVCLDDDGAGISVGDAALRLLEDYQATIVVAVPRSGVLGQAVPTRSDLDEPAPSGRPRRRPAEPAAVRTMGKARLVLVSVIRTVYTIAAMRTGMNEGLARAIHEAYRRHALAQGDSVDTNASVRPWDELPDDLKDANREQAWDIGRKLTMAGLSAVPASRSAGSVGLTDGDVERLAKVEHRRWMDEREAKGWRHGTVRDSNRKLHPDLVEWEYLSEDSRDKDRAAVRAIPEHLDAAGLRIVRTR